MGHVGPVVASSLRAGGHGIVAVSAHSDAALERAAIMLPGVPQLSPEEVVDKAEVVLLAVPDRVIASLADSLPWRPGQVAIHLSGALGLDVLSGASEAGVTPASIHPVMTFQGLSLDLKRLKEAPMAITAPTLALPLIEVLASEIGGKPFVIAEAARPLYHAALSHGANHLVTLISQAKDLLSEAGIEEPAAVLRPLVTAALDGALDYGMGALTGPVARNDTATVEKHNDALANTRAADTYRWMSRATAEELEYWRANEADN
jgi:Uncharacterized conserved protein